SNQQDVGFGQFDAVSTSTLTVHIDALVVVVNGDRQLLLGLLLTDNVLVEESLYLLRFGKLVRGLRGRSRGAVVFQNGIADRHALVTNVGARITAGGRD